MARSFCGFVGERVRGYVWFTCFAVLLSGPMVLSSLTRRRSTVFELTVDTRLLLLYVIALPRYYLLPLCCSTDGWVFRLVDVSMGSWVGGWVVTCVGSYVVDCVLSLLLWVLTI